MRIYRVLVCAGERPGIVLFVQAWDMVGLRRTLDNATGITLPGVKGLVQSWTLSSARVVKRIPRYARVANPGQKAPVLHASGA